MTTKASIDVEQFVAGVHKYIGEVVRPLIERIEALEQREAKSLADAYKGSYLPSRYERGALVSHGGGLWICVETGDGRPGESKMWRLVIKSPRG